MTEHKLRLLLADDHPVFRAGLKSLIDAQHDMIVVGEAGDGRAAWTEVQSLVPDVVIMDLNMPELNGTRATERIMRVYPTVKVLVLTLHEEHGYLRRLLEAGATGYVLKQAPGEAIISAIRAVAAGGIYLDPAITHEVLGGHAPSSVLSRSDRRSALLSERERSVLQSIALGYSNKEISQQIGISVKTVETHRERLMNKLDLHSRADLVRFALHQGWLNEE